jgi:ribosomal protein L11 methylase PrmA
VGCGTGILSLFAARSGAKKVYGVDLAEIIYFARSIVEANNYSHKVTIFKKLAEDLTQDDIPEQIDILVSEWMGYGLLYEGMFESIIDAREKFKPK